MQVNAYQQSINPLSTLAIPLALYIMAFTSCKQIYSNRDFKRFGLEDFSEIRRVESQLTPFQDSLVFPTKTDIIGDYLIITDQKSICHVHLFDIKTYKYLGSYILNGSASGEMLLPWVTAVDQARTFYSYDIRNKKIVGWHASSFQNERAPIIQFSVSDRAVISGMAFTDDFLYYTDLLNYRARLFSFNRASHVTSFIGELPALSYRCDNVVRSQANRAVLAANKDQLILANYLSPLFEIYDISKKEWHSFVGPDQSEPKFQTSEKHFVVTGETKLGYIDIKTTDRFIYLLYSGDFALESKSIDQGKHLFVMDYDGHPRSHLMLDKPIAAFAVYKDSAVYAIHFDLKPELLTFTVN